MVLQEFFLKFPKRPVKFALSGMSLIQNDIFLFHPNWISQRFSLFKKSYLIEQMEVTR